MYIITIEHTAHVLLYDTMGTIKFIDGHKVWDSRLVRGRYNLKGTDVRRDGMIFQSLGGLVETKSLPFRYCSHNSRHKNPQGCA